MYNKDINPSDDEKNFKIQVLFKLRLWDNNKKDFP